MKLRGVTSCRSCRPDCHNLAPCRKPFRGELEVLAGQAVAGAQHLIGDVGAGLAEQCRQQARALDRDQLVVMGRRSAAPGCR